MMIYSYPRGQDLLILRHVISFCKGTSKFLNYHFWKLWCSNALRGNAKSDQRPLDNGESPGTFCCDITNITQSRKSKEKIQITCMVRFRWIVALLIIIYANCSNFIFFVLPVLCNVTWCRDKVRLGLLQCKGDWSGLT